MSKSKQSTGPGFFSIMKGFAKKHPFLATLAGVAIGIGIAAFITGAVLTGGAMAAPLLFLAVPAIVGKTLMLGAILSVFATSITYLFARKEQLKLQGKNIVQQQISNQQEQQPLLQASFNQPNMVSAPAQRPLPAYPNVAPAEPNAPLIKVVLPPPPIARAGFFTPSQPNATPTNGQQGYYLDPSLIPDEDSNSKKKFD